jgi:DNA-directed RNA polymerase specialized sigma subunit
VADANPLEDYSQTKQAAKEQRKAEELELWSRWKETKKPEHLEPLLQRFEPIFQNHMKAKPPMIPASAYHADLMGHAIKAFNSFDPSRGAALNTHVEWGLKKATRYGNRGANLSYVPEAMANKIEPINKARDILTEDLGRDPTHQEIAQHLGMPAARVKTIINAVRRDIPMSHTGGEGNYDYSGSSESPEHELEEQQIAIAANVLPDIFPNKPEFHSLFNHLYGTNGLPQISSTTELAKKLGKSPSQISRMKSQLGATLKKHMGLGGKDE